MKCACGKVFDKMGKLEESQSKELIALLVDALAFLRKVTLELNQFKKDLLKSRLTDKMRQLATNVPGDSTFFFGDDLAKRISEINSSNNSLAQTFDNNNNNMAGIITHHASTATIMLRM